MTTQQQEVYLQLHLDTLYCLDAMLDMCYPRKNKPRITAGRYQAVTPDVKEMCDEALHNR